MQTHIEPREHHMYTFRFTAVYAMSSTQFIVKASTEHQAQKQARGVSRKALALVSHGCVETDRKLAQCLAGVTL